MVTYNHERFVGRAIESVLEQQVDFPIEIVIGEDCSRDRTREVVLGYRDRHPGLIRVLERESNVGAAINVVETLNACRGEYIALLDGDDYWISANKLRRQVELMDSRADLSMCFNPYRSISEENEGRLGPVDSYPQGNKPLYRLADLADWIRIHPSSVLLRRKYLRPFPDWYYDVFHGDWAMYVFWAEHGDIGCIPEVMSIYRIHSGGILQSMRGNRIAALKSNLRMLEQFIEYLGPNRSRPFRDATYRRYYDLAHVYAELGRVKEAQAWVSRCTRDMGWGNPRVYWREPFNVLLKMHTPRLHRNLRRLKAVLSSRRKNGTNRA